MKRTLLCSALLALCSYSSANTIESRSLSKNAPAIITASQNTNWELIQKNQVLENDIRKLRGQLEEYEHQLNQLKNEINNRYTDLDQRMEILSQKIDPSEIDENDALAASDELGTNSTSTSKPVSEEERAYTVALDVYKKQGAAAAIAPMQQFIQNNPNSIYIANAHYWLGGFHLSSNPVNFEQAKKNFNIVINQYPRSSKVSAAVYQLYDIAEKVDRNTVLANQLKQRLLKDHPNSKEAGYLK